MKKTTADLPELAQKAATDKTFRDHLFWSLVTLHPDAFLRLVNGEPMITYRGPNAGSGFDDRPMCIMTDYRDTTIAVSPELYRRVRDFAVMGKKVDAIKELRAGAGLGLKEAKDYVEGTFPTNPSRY